MGAKRDRAAEVVSDHVRAGDVPMSYQRIEDLRLHSEVDRVVRLFRRPAVAGHVPEIDGVSVGQGGGNRLPNHRRPWRAVAEHHCGAGTGPFPRDLTPLPVVALGQIHTDVRTPISVNSATTFRPRMKWQAIR